MLCDNCGKEIAKVHYKEIKDDKTVEFNLCEKCAVEKGLHVSPKKQAFSISNILAGMAEEVGSSTARCQGCGLSYAEFRETGRLGCSECYGAFKEQLKPLLRRIHGSNVHIGKSPQSSEGMIEKIREIEDLKVALRVAIEKEDFENAAEIRDRIKSLETREDSKP
ncbi:MAG: UvrB/UvrC motif-containing protein [Candidatus Eisenbacteria bacterium]